MSGSAVKVSQGVKLAHDDYALERECVHHSPGTHRDPQRAGCSCVDAEYGTSRLREPAGQCWTGSGTIWATVTKDLRLVLLNTRSRPVVYGLNWVLLSPADWHRDHLDPTLAVLRAPDGPFSGCSTDSRHGGHRTEVAAPTDPYPEH
ncbi:hypothetical protein GCM10022226_45500 [Sphaerisporangium flaviroseum]|uniref:Uncharacterized protein n=1 Tax=Sphaerisporangium flaviroseum TaxID=509199 RepID=A0ABP7IJE2_9ACTN